MSSVKVAVRVRPFNDREKANNSQLIIKMVDNTTSIQNPVSEHRVTDFSIGDEAMEGLCV
jgi:hypothetical protein